MIVCVKHLLGRTRAPKAAVWPLVSNTRAGPMHDARQRVIDVFGKLVPRLYAAGGLGSVLGHLYLSEGSLAVCFAGGRSAGRAAADETSADGAT